jgi:glycolate oxidase FAD binding subunit
MAGVMELAEQIRAAAGSGRAVCIRAGGSKDFYGNASRGEPLDPRGLHGIVDYEPAELFVTARAGTSLAALEATLAASGQMLAFEPPHFSGTATVGGCVAAGLAGPRRSSSGFTYGAVRDFVLGASLLDGRGELLRFGGTVIKNVAGYDVARALAGSLGILGLITDVSLKVVPLPAAEATLRFALDAPQALARLCDWGGQPLPISASAWCGGLLHLRLSGAGAAVGAAVGKLGGEVLSQAEASNFWADVREHRHAFFAGELPLWRLSLPSTAPEFALGGEQFIEWGGALRWLRSTQAAAPIRARAQQLGGHATLFRGGDRTAGAFTPLPATLLAIHRRLKAEFDPAGIFNPGRLYPEL